MRKLCVSTPVARLLCCRDKSGTIVTWEKKFAYFMIAFAVVVSITGITSSIYSLVQYT